MPRLRYQPEAFGAYMGAAFCAPGEVVFSWAELCRAAVTVGRRNWADVLQFGTYSVLEMLWRVAMVRANLMESATGHLLRSGAFRGLDRSEKAAISYFLGLVLTKLLAERLFEVSWLLHVDVYRELLQIELDPAMRPDFVGLDPDGLWIVLESKGRYGGLPDSVLDQGKQQARSLRRISGVPPVLQIAVATHFSGGDYRARLRDPDDHAADGVDIEVDPEAHVRAYYRPIIEAIEAAGTQIDRTNRPTGSYILAQLSGMDAVLVLDERVLRWYRDRRTTVSTLLRELSTGTGHRSALRSIERLRQDEAETQQAPSRDRLVWESETARRTSEPRAIGYDGVFVEVGDSWSTDYMRREPRDREQPGR